MPLTPLDIHNKQFRRALFGYNGDEVDEFLDEVIRDYEALIRENDHLREKLADCDGKIAHYRSLEETLNSTLIMAQEMAEEVKNSARKEAELIVREAELKAEEVIQGAEARVKEAKEEYRNLKKGLYVLRARIRGAIQAHLELLDRQVEDIEHDMPDPASDAEDTKIAPPV